MDSKLGDEHYMGEGLPQDEIHYSEENPMQVVYAKRDDFTRKRFPATRPGTSSTGRARRVVSCKRKTHHLVVVRRKPATAGRPCGSGNKENERARTEDPRTCMDDDDTDQEMFHVDPWEFPLNVNKHQGGGTGSKQHTDCFTLGELTRDHSSMVNVLFGRNLRLKVASTLWQRNVGELLTYFLRMEDTGVIVDFLPIITQSIHEDSSGFTIGCCVDLFPFVKKVLSSPYEEYVAVGLKWIQSVLKKWFEQLLASGLTGRTNNHLDKNFQVFNQQLVNLWHHDPGSSLVLKMPPTLAKVIDSYLSQLT
ncbi:KATNB1-like protein 1 isoform X1 [Gadus morhua]|uniref:KATNB1-like protein 1 n=1 Tax=Gadus morhua TaxID=8049 RepID=A0A8C5FIV9_GADMO|nr:KATNB1-like protein 1 isoform X1 [Gadus morhua]XP_030212104.1 KATNB1-like protein 1 isoform X1 [Gadus morhua]XP_030212105.1 KATNB1-like protein 1 isoform X1 [Gadus morhua]XP_030212106.1 KATNB1-like protein 1 isoform X1 [Gadus morhua]XP_030212107.1 KATNB1-like protein 1 isoform X1 [Gadus morhua]